MGKLGLYFIIINMLVLPLKVDSAVTGIVTVNEDPAIGVSLDEDDNDSADVSHINSADDQVPDEAFIRANQLYLDGSYEEAIIVYEKVLNSGYHSAALYYNLGNAYYRSNKIPPSILNYERAALLSPGDHDIRFNLELARMHVRDRIEELPDFFINRWWRNLRNLAGTGKWASISVFAFIISLVMLSIFLVSSTVHIKKIFFWLFVGIFIFSILSFSLGLDQSNYIRNHNTAIVFSPVVSVKSSPDVNSTDLFIIHEGTKVWVEESLGDWLAVRLSDGNKGWLKKDVIEMI